MYTPVPITRIIYFILLLLFHYIFLLLPGRVSPNTHLGSATCSNRFNRLPFTQPRLQLYIMYRQRRFCASMECASQQTMAKIRILLITAAYRWRRAVAARAVIRLINTVETQTFCHFVKLSLVQSDFYIKDETLSPYAFLLFSKQQQQQ